METMEILNATMSHSKSGAFQMFKNDTLKCSPLMLALTTVCFVFILGF